MLFDDRIDALLAPSLYARADRADFSGNHIVNARCTPFESVAAFLRDTSDDDRYRRFGNVSTASVEWLIERMQTDRRRGAYVAQSGGRLIGLLDFVGVDENLEFGVLVRSSRRRQGVGSSLIRSFLEGVGGLRPGTRIVAHCDPANRAALRLMRSSGLRSTHHDRGWTRFETSVPTPGGSVRGG